MHPLVRLAKEAIRIWIEEKREISLSNVTLTDEMQKKAGVFVSLKIYGSLRGCIGTYIPQTENVATEIIQNAISAASRDPRFSPVTADELSHLSYSVDVLSLPERVKSIKDLNSKKYGVLVKQGSNRGLLLPDIEGIDTPEEQIRIAKLKAGIPQDMDVDLYRFTVRRYQSG